MNHCIKTLTFLVAVSGYNVSFGQPAHWPDNVTEFANQLVGEWEISGSLMGSEVKGEASIKWGTGKTCVMQTTTITGGDTDKWEVVGNAIAGWDPVRKQIVDYHFSSSGLISNFLSHNSKNKNVWKGERRLVREDKEYKQKVEVSFEVAGELHATLTSPDGEQVQGKLIYKRKK